MDITSAIMDPEPGCCAFTAERISYVRGAEGTTSRSQTFQAMGCVHPGTPEMVQMLPEEDRHEESAGREGHGVAFLPAEHGESDDTGPRKGKPDRVSDPMGRYIRILIRRGFPLSKVPVI